MSQPLPTDGFEWMTSKEVQSWTERQLCIHEVDLQYPQELHDLYNDYPLAPKKTQVDKVEKLIPNLRDKETYVKQCLDLGLKLTKIHIGIKFEESPFMKKYIDPNTKLRTASKSEFEKDFFKFMNNSVFGKTMENIRNRVDVQLINSESKAMKLTAKPSYDHLTISDENLVAVHMKRSNCILTSPSTSELASWTFQTKMYDFNYGYIRPKYGDRAKLLATDTDSYLYKIQTEDFQKGIAPDVKKLFNT